MIKPEEVNLIIFDLDGTIVMSQPLVYEAVKRAFAKLGWPVNFKIEEIKQFIGNSTATTGGSLYEFITPPNSPITPDKVREKVRAEYPDIFRTTALTFPGIKETLAILRKRGYKLAQYTNASTVYLNTVISSLNIRDYYDHIECIQDNGLTKNQLVKKIKEKFGLQAAVVGDRHHDIEAARENGCLSIGALYGYGDTEPYEADLTIRQFTELLDIFDRRKMVFNVIINDMKNGKRERTPFIIGVNGIDCSGKTMFATALENHLKNNGWQTQLIHIDDFHNPKAVRYAGSDEADNYYYRSFDIMQLTERILKPVREQGGINEVLTLLNLETEKYDKVRKYSITPDTIVILEGVFLFRKELIPYIDYKIYLDIPFKESKKRAVSRDPAAGLTKYDTKYLPAQQKYIRELSPAFTADINIDNTDWEYPIIKSHRKY